MAKKMSKSTKKAAPTKKSPKTEGKNMVSKVEIKKPMDQDQVSRIVGTVFIVVGAILIGFGIYSYIKFRQTPELDVSLEAPSMVGISRLTNGDEVIIKGVAEDYDDVFVYVDGEEVDTVKVQKDDSFEYVYMVEEEGSYAVAVAGVKGFPKRIISEQSEAEVVTVDWTAPELVAIDYSPEVGTETFSIVGETEPSAEISVKRGVDSYSAIADENGEFKIMQIGLEEGPNVFNVEVKDVAGNVAKVDEKVRVIYSPESDVNGDAIADDSLPVAAGDLDDAMEYMFGNTMMFVFGIIALAGFGVSSVYVVKKQRA